MRYLFLVLICLLSVTIMGCKQPDARSGKVVVSGTADIGGPFTLVNQDGETVTEADFFGKPQLIYFGFSFCPDICPMALQQMGAVQDAVDPKGNKLTYLFFSVDPERDTPESLKQYVTANGFPKGLIGLTGTTEQVEAAKKAYHVYAVKAEDPESSAGYTVDHVSLIFLMDENGDYVDVFTHSTEVPEMIARTRDYLKAVR